MTSYQGNGSNVAATTVTTANKLAPTTGGVETNNTTALTASTTGWIQLFSQGTGTAQTGAGSEPTITDVNNFGWMNDTGIFDLQTFFAGNWNPTITMKLNAGTIQADIHCLILQRPNGGGVYGILGDVVKSAVVIGSVAKTVAVLPTTALASAAFAVGDRLCTIWLLNITSGHASATLMSVYMSTSASIGVASDAEIVSPGFAPTPVVGVVNINPVIPGAVIGPSMSNQPLWLNPSHMGLVQGRRLGKPLGGRGLAGKHPFKRGFRLW